MAKLQDVTENDFQDEVLGSEKPVLVDFWAPWCGPCKIVSPIVEELAEEYSGEMGFTKLNVDDAPNIALKYQVMSIPTLIVFQGGEPVGAGRRRDAEEGNQGSPALQGGRRLAERPDVSRLRGNDGGSWE